MSNTFGKFFKITTAGESHGGGYLTILDGCPPGLELSQSDLQKSLDRRAPGQSEMTTPRKEPDQAEILSGVFEGRTTGTPIGVLVRNVNQNSNDYAKLRNVFRPNHADFSYIKKYGTRDPRGGGRSSARETLARVIGGAVAEKFLCQHIGENFRIFGFAREIGGEFFPNVDPDFIEKNPLRMADKERFDETFARVQSLKKSGDSLGGVIEIRVQCPPAGLGSPVFDKLEARLAAAAMSVGGVKFFEMGSARQICAGTGSQASDPFQVDQKTGQIRTEKNLNGGVLGGISTGEEIVFRVGLKPTSSISKPQKTVDASGNAVEIQVSGRHDPILVPRGVPILESMTALVLFDEYLAQAALGAGK